MGKTRHYRGLSPASSSCCSWCLQREGTEACLPGHGMGWKQPSAPHSLSLKNTICPGHAHQGIFHYRLGCLAHLLTEKILFSMLIKSARLCSSWCCSSRAGAKQESAFSVSTPGDYEVPRAEALGCFGNHWLKPVFLKLGSLDALLKVPNSYFFTFCTLFLIIFQILRASWIIWLIV